MAAASSGDQVIAINATRSKSRSRRRLPAGLGVLLLVAAFALPAHAAPPPPPGGHHPIHFGGNNRAGYPPLNQVVGVPREGAPVAAALSVTAQPNPFRASTRLRFATQPGERVRVRVFTTQGRMVRELAAGSGAGTQQAVWDGRDQRGRRLPPAVYLYRVDAGARSARGKLVLIR
jgi:hypothetical protein